MRSTNQIATGFPSHQPTWTSNSMFSHTWQLYLFFAGISDQGRKEFIIKIHYFLVPFLFSHWYEVDVWYFTSLLYQFVLESVINARKQGIHSEITLLSCSLSVQSLIWGRCLIFYLVVLSVCAGISDQGRKEFIVKIQYCLVPRSVQSLIWCRCLIFYLVVIVLSVSTLFSLFSNYLKTLFAFFYCLSGKPNCLRITSKTDWKRFTKHG
jgi:hypothetical protein